MSATSFAHVSQYLRSPHSLDDLCEDDARRKVERWEGQVGVVSVRSLLIRRVRRPPRMIRFGRIPVEVDLVDLGVEAVVVRSQRSQAPPTPAANRSLSFERLFEASTFAGTAIGRMM